MYKRILVAVDGSETSDAALSEAIALASDQKAELRLIHVVDITAAYSLAETPFPFVDYQKVLVTAAEKLLAKCADTVRRENLSVTTTCPVIDMLGRRIWEVIDAEAKRWPAELIVLGTHGRHGINRVLLGSVAEGVIRTATKPVLSVKGG
jgi:nucleotide-binding universal stress UspA family protein